ncbi:cytochrome P450 [Mycolicibacterium moriokaense]|jgi:cytochrome P450|uniref:Cytochrome P450 n=1 Tax=Mycolicibacterium moriokaense TaxID=39691 RepID=A0AAD1H7A8_9MYCO|nr:cytochrome P450 [Mycolicibacterium moriokaense]MCV7039568.1 cytochrome P450 [Mycolicibacterium moriokaense]ORB17299.1 cytochrome P450 [Mycolicibacterium moriokaense]BBW99758.1 cytochrome P450 [Mycolicibacterium moriokaense]
MTDAATIDTEAPTTQGKMPPVVRLPKAVQGVLLAGFRRRFLSYAQKRYGSVFAINVPFFSHSVVVSDPKLVRQVFLASTDDLINVQPNLSRIFGPGSVFALDGTEHRARRKLLAPPFHGQSIKNYEKIIEEETLRESANWPEGKEFRTLEPMNRITLSVILRAVFGADGAELDYLREIIPPWAELGSRMATLPEPSFNTTRYSPWGRLTEFRRNFDRTVFALIDKARSDPRFEERTDILALLLRSTYEDGTPMSDQDVSDELLTLLGAGHETTASTLGWAFERLRRHPDILAKLVEENDAGGNEYRQAFIQELQRNRTVIDFSGRHVLAPHFDLGEWRIPRGYTVMLALAHVHADPEVFPDPERLDPDRFLNTRTPTAWVPFGGGTRRCIGAAFANAELDVVLRTILREFVIETDNAPDEKVHFRGIAFTPKAGGLVTLRRR